MKEETKGQSRREFLSSAALLSVGAGALLSSCNKEPKLTPLMPADQVYAPELPDKAVAGKALRAGVVGCGGRGSGAIVDLLNAADGIEVVALGDVFEDRLSSLRTWLTDEYAQNIPDENCHIGFDAYKKVIDCGLDIVILATPPAFRPEHYRYAVEKNCHAFLEKPIAVDPAGVRTILAASKQAKAKGLCCVTGTQRHHQRSYIESYKKIQEGLIGEITGGNVYWNQSMLWYRNREAGWSDMEWMIRDWVNWTWLSGDHIVEQHVHNIDVFNWFIGKYPIKATAIGSRQRRITGDQYDSFSVDFEYEGGIHMHSLCRQIDGCANNVSEFIQGTKGSWNSNEMKIRNLKGEVIWEFDWDAENAQYKQTNPYVLEHVNLVNCIRNKQYLNQAEECALSSLAGVMGREAAYSGATVTWEEISNSPLNLMPEKLALGKMDMSKYKVPVPGSSQG